MKEIENTQNVQCYVHFRVTEQYDGINFIEKNFDTVQVFELNHDFSYKIICSFQLLVRNPLKNIIEVLFNEFDAGMFVKRKFLFQVDNLVCKLTGEEIMKIGTSVLKKELIPSHQKLEEKKVNIS